MNITKWIMAELSAQEQERMERLIDPARQIALIGIFFRSIDIVGGNRLLYRSLG